MVHGNQSDNHCNRSNTWPSILLPELRLQTLSSLSLSIKHRYRHTDTHTCTHTRMHARTCAHTRQTHTRTTQTRTHTHTHQAQSNMLHRPHLWRWGWCSRRKSKSWCVHPRAAHVHWPSPWNRKAPSHWRGFWSWTVLPSLPSGLESPSPAWEALGKSKITKWISTE